MRHGSEGIKARRGPKRLGGSVLIRHWVGRRPAREDCSPVDRGVRDGTAGRGGLPGRMRFQIGAAALPRGAGADEGVGRTGLGGVRYLLWGEPGRGHSGWGAKLGSPGDFLVETAGEASGLPGLGGVRCLLWGEPGGSHRGVEVLDDRLGPAPGSAAPSSSPPLSPSPPPAKPNWGEPGRSHWWVA